MSYLGIVKEKIYWSQISNGLYLSTIPETKNILKDDTIVEAILKIHRYLIEKQRAIIQKADEARDEDTIDLHASYLEKESWMLDARCSKRFLTMTS